MFYLFIDNVSYRTSLDVKLSNLRESFPLSEKMIEEINKLTQMKPVDESSIGFKTSKRRSSEKPSPNTSLHGKNELFVVLRFDFVTNVYFVLIVEGACDECHDIIAVFKCSDCKDSIFCESCCHEVSTKLELFIFGYGRLIFVIIVSGSPFQY